MGILYYVWGMVDEALELDEESLTHLTRRNRNLVRAVNISRGMRRADEKPPEDHWKRRFPELEQNLLDEYYRFKGWNDQGMNARKPTPSSAVALSWSRRTRSRRIRRCRRHTTT